MLAPPVPLQAEQAEERQRQQEAEEAVRHIGPRAIDHDAEPPLAALLERGDVVPGNVLDPESTAAAAAAVAAAAAPPQRGQFGKAGRGRSYSNGVLVELVHDRATRSPKCRCSRPACHARCTHDHTEG